MHVLITPDNTDIENALQKAEEQIKKILVQCVHDPSSKKRLLEEISISSKHSQQNNFEVSYQQHTSERSLSTISAGKSQPRDDSSILDDRPRKVQKKCTEEMIILIPSWVTTKRGWFGES